MAIGSPPITWDLRHTGEPSVYIGTPLPNPSGNTGVMVCLCNNKKKSLFNNLKHTTNLRLEPPFKQKMPVLGDSGNDHFLYCQ